MKRTRWVLAIALAMTLTAAACSSSDDATTTTAGDNSSGGGEDATGGCDALDGAVVGYSEPLPDPNFAIIEDAIETQLESVGASLTAVNANLDPGKQISDVNSLNQQGIDVLLINPVDPNAVQAVIGEVSDAGTPVVVQDTKVGGPYTTNVTADVEAAARDGAKQLKELVGDGQVAAVYGPNFAEVIVREIEAFEAEAEEIGLDVVTSATNQAITPDAAAEIASGWKQQYGDELAGIWTFNDTSAVGVASTFDDDFEPALVSINGQPEAIPLVEDGTIDVTYDLQQDMLGRALAYAAINAICDEPLPEDIWVESKVIDESNVGDWVDPSERAQEEVTVTLEDRDGRSFLVEG